ncbi:hypothetical protein IR128_11300 [Staphylococcus lentus]|uniref:hypothetical protein n=1 Tax=Mammaliicoccus lentus TaxID=42858 RepID=UPI001883CA89|nr:hypothetical protein [Mammaliicoccus lentus]MBF0842295.1 hypothetical protein [Mammaliicoccus lentus]
MLFADKEMIDVLETKLIGYTNLERLYENECNIEAVMIRTILFNDQTIKFVVMEALYTEVDIDYFIKQIDVGSESYEEIYFSQQFNKYVEAIGFVNEKYKLKSKYEIVNIAEFEELVSSNN